MIEIAGNEWGVRHFTPVFTEGNCTKLACWNSRTVCLAGDCLSIFDDSFTQDVFLDDPVLDFDVKHGSVYSLTQSQIFRGEDVLAHLRTPCLGIQVTPSPFVVLVHSESKVLQKDARTRSELPLRTVPNIHNLACCSCCHRVAVLADEVELFDNRFLVGPVLTYPKLYTTQERVCVFHQAEFDDFFVLGKDSLERKAPRRTCSALSD